MIFIPESWKSKRQIIIETYVRTGSVPETAEKVYGKRDVSYVRTIVLLWRRKVREEEKERLSLPVDNTVGVQGTGTA